MSHHHRRADLRVGERLHLGRASEGDHRCCPCGRFNSSVIVSWVEQLVHRFSLAVRGEQAEFFDSVRSKRSPPIGDRNQAGDGRVILWDAPPRRCPATARRVSHLGRAPINSIGISSPTTRPERRIMRSASSRMLTGCPRSRMKTSPPWTGRRPGGRLHRLVHAHEEPGHVRIGDSDRSTARDLRGEGRDDAAAAADHVAEADRAPPRPCGARRATICSPMRLSAHDVLGRTALSVEMNTNRSTPHELGDCETFRRADHVGHRLAGWASRSGTCLWAAAWKTTSGR